MQTVATTKVARIHSDFKQSISEAVIIPNNKVIVGEEFASVLESIGMINSKPYSKIRNLRKNIDHKSTSNILQERVNDLIAKYPQYRLIGFKRVYELLSKYDLKLGLTSNYIGDIPVKNLQEIFDYKETVAESEYRCVANMQDLFTGIDRGYNYNFGGMTTFIVAPRDHFNKDGTFINNIMMDKAPSIIFSMKGNTDGFSFPQPQDPIILCLLKTPRIEGALFHIVTAWGEEAEDEYVTNKIKIKTVEN